MWVSTFHSACSRILRREATLLGYRSSFSIYDQADAVRLTDYVRRDLEPRPEAVPAPAAARRDLGAEERARARRSRRGDGASTPPERRIAEVYTRVPAAAARGVGRRLRRPARARGAAVPRAPRRARALAQPLPARARRRVPGHQRRAVGARAPARRGAPQRHGRRRHAISASSRARAITMGDGSTRPIEASQSATRCCRATAAATSARRGCCARTSRMRSSGVAITSRAVDASCRTPEHMHFAGFVSVARRSST